MFLQKWLKEFLIKIMYSFLVNYFFNRRLSIHDLVAEKEERRGMRRDFIRLSMLLFGFLNPPLRFTTNQLSVAESFAREPRLFGRKSGS